MSSSYGYGAIASVQTFTFTFTFIFTFTKFGTKVVIVMYSLTKPKLRIKFEVASFNGCRKK